MSSSVTHRATSVGVRRRQSGHDVPEAGVDRLAYPVPGAAGQGRYEEAEALARDALDAHRTPSRLALVLHLGLARSLNGQGRHEEALAEAVRADALRRKALEGSRMETGAVGLAFAAALLGLGRAAEARTRAMAAHDTCRTGFGPDHHRTVGARALLDRIDGT